MCLLVFIFGLGFGAKAWAATYYVDCNAVDDLGAGTSTGTAWKTINKVNTSSFNPDDSILFNRGCTWREQLTIPSSGASGHPITFGAYGSGNKPLFLGSEDVIGVAGDWTDEGSNVWSRTLATESKVVMFDGSRWTLNWTAGILDTTPDTKYEWGWISGTPNKLKVYSVGNPTSYYTAIEASQRENIILGDNKDYITLDNIQAWIPGYDAISFATKGIGIIANSIEAYYFYGGTTANGITNHNANSTLTVTGSKFLYGDGPGIGIGGTGPVFCSVDQTEMGYSRQGFGAGSTPGTYIVTRSWIHDTSAIGVSVWAGTLTLKNSLVQNTGSYGVYGQTGAVHYLYNNTIYNTTTYAIYASTTTNLTMKNNIVYDPDGPALRLDATATYTGDYNIYWRDTNSALFRVGATSYNRDDFSNYKAAVSPQDANSPTPSTPVFVSSGSNFHLQNTSPAINAGTNVGLTEDYEGNPVPSGSGYDIGAYEYQADTTPNAFVFTDITNASLSTQYSSNTITVAGVDDATAITITGGTYSKNGGAYTANAGTVAAGDTVTVRVNSSASYSTAVNATVTIGGVSDTYTVTTLDDTTAPDTTIDSHPDSSTISTSATFDFSSDDENATLWCKLDDADYAICTSPQDYASLTLGDHAFFVKAIDEEDNEDLSPATFSWTISETPAPADDDDDEDYDELDISKVKYSVIDNNQIKITFKTNNYSKGTTRFGTDKNLKKKEKESTNKKKHTINLKNLIPGTKYYFRISAEDKHDQNDRSKIYSVTLPKKVAYMPTANKATPKPQVTIPDSINQNSNNQNPTPQNSLPVEQAGNQNQTDRNTDMTPNNSSSNNSPQPQNTFNWYNPFTWF